MNKQLSVEVVQETSWNRALNAARRTAGKEPIEKEPSREWKRMSLFAEHSQIKLVEYRISFKNLRQWVGIHLLRHEHNLPFIHSQREDRNKETKETVDRIMSIIKADIKDYSDYSTRDFLFQGERNDQDFYVNAQTLINISRKRLCACASPETRQAWMLVKNAVIEIDPDMGAMMVPNCIYRGRCPERTSCGYYRTEAFKNKLDEYWKQIGR